MSNLPELKALRIEDYSDSPDWFKKFILNLGKFIETNYTILNRDINFTDNIRAVVKTINPLRTVDIPLTLRNELKVRPTGLFKVACDEIAGNTVILTSAVDVHWILKDTGDILIDNVTGLTAGKNYRLIIVYF